MKTATLEQKEYLFSRNLVADELWELFVRVSKTKKITAADRDALHAVFLDSATNKEVFELIDRICWLLRRERLQVVG